MKKEFQSPYHALTAQTEALARLVEAWQNAREHGFSFRINYHRKKHGDEDLRTFVAVASPCDLYDYDEAEIPIPDTIEWDISHLFRSRMLDGSDKIRLYLTPNREDD